jgi:N-acetylmuramoyl-L-alanine amidase
VGSVRLDRKNWLYVLLCGALLGGLPGARGAENGPVPGAAPDGPPAATDARLAGDESRTRFVVDLTRSIDISAFTLADPYRVVIDMPHVTFHLPAKAAASRRGLVKAFRFGLVMQGGSRIVLDATGPVRVEKAFVLDPIDSQPARLVVELVAVDRDSFLRDLAIANGTGRSEPVKKADRDQPPKVTDPRPAVVLDPGHGGLDSGTVAASGETEKAIVLAFANKLRKKLENTGKYRVLMTRSDDRLVPLAARVRFARSHQAELFISIHADALGHREEARGATVYTLSETASDAEAARLAEQENRADVIAGVDLSAEPDDVADILIDLAQRETKIFSSQFARTLVGVLKTAAHLHKHPLKAAGFRVLKAPDVPSVLIELGFVSSRKDLKLLTSDAWQSRTADSMIVAINSFFATRLAGAGAPPGSN